MFVSKAFQTLGRSLIILGGLTLLFVAYQPWGTGVLTDRYQSDLEEDFTELIEVVEKSTSTTDTPKTSDTDIPNYAELCGDPRVRPWHK